MKKKFLGALIGIGGGVLMSMMWLISCDVPDCHRTQTCEDSNGSINPSCTEGTGMDLGAACNAHCTTPCTQCASMCQDAGLVPSCGTCIEAMNTYWPASAEAMVQCLAPIGVCDLNGIDSCINQVENSAAACDPEGPAAALCAEIYGGCPASIAQCSRDISPFHTQALSAFKNCVNLYQDGGFVCGSAHATCLIEVRNMSFPPP